MFRPLYDKVLSWSAHRHAPAYLGALSFAESSFFPVPPDVMLGPMCLARPQRAWYYATLCTLASVAGGIAGYLVGRLAFEAIEGWLMASSWAPAFERAVSAFDTWGFWYVLLAGFSPIPYKVFTISAGMLQMPVLPFVLGSIVGRGGRFFLVAGLIRLGGEKLAVRLRDWVDWIGWATVALVAIGALAWHFTGQGA
ncbi:DedA family protein [Marinihelvus fidelis]|uniref:DedA family protein n=1 Tax=Marinihelvus fidelis TaxID=2613842 RepID=A0A5N0TBM8_9GAMM|nr:YqaA family protein [Marinihelvus fidelis]KAA9132483.1 DedA family protein [Marinihelvus fidelis]